MGGRPPSLRFAEEGERGAGPGFVRVHLSREGGTRQGLRPRGTRQAIDPRTAGLLAAAAPGSREGAARGPPARPPRLLQHRPAPPRPPPPSEGIKFRPGAGGPAYSASAARELRRCGAMASEELAQKLQRRLLLEESGAAAEGDEREAEVPAPSEAGEEERSCLTASADAELSAKLARRHDINEGAAQPRRAAVFNPYTEFKEFSRRQIKDMERMFRL